MNRRNLTVASWLAIIFAGGLLARLAVSFFLADNHTLYFEHMLIARNLLEGKGYVWDEWGRAMLQPTSLVPPLCVYWCAFFQWLSPHNFLPMYLAQALISASGVVPAFLIGKRMFSSRIGMVFALLYSFYPEFVFIHSKAVAESIYVVLVLWMIECYLVLTNVRIAPPRIVRASITCGVFAGVAMLFKEAAVVVALAVGMALIIRYAGVWSQLRPRLVSFTFSTLLILSPWIIRNVVVQREFIPLRTAFGINWWVANQPGSAGNDRREDGSYVLSELPIKNPEYNTYMNSILAIDEQDRDRVYTSEVWRLIKQDPSHYLKLCAKRLQYWIWFVPGHQLASNAVYRASWILLLLFALPGIALAARRKQMNVVFPLILLGYVFYYVPTIVLPRYRVVTSAILLLFAAISVDAILSGWRERQVVPARVIPSGNPKSKPR